jgi:hypothetical protein
MNGLLWYATRTAGEVALVFLTAVVALGVMSAARVGGRRTPRFVVAGLHRNLTLAGLGFLAVHIAAAVLDTYAPIRLADTVVPFTSAYRPVWLALGALAPGPHRDEPAPGADRPAPVEGAALGRVRVLDPRSGARAGDRYGHA